MEPNNNYEQEIDLKDLMFAVLRRWRPIIIIAVVFAVLLGGLKTVKGINQLSDEEYVKKNQDTYKMNMEQYTSTKDRLEKEIQNLQDNIESQKEYKEQSILMNINPYDEYVETATFYISTDYSIMPGMVYQNPNTATSILKAYMSIAQNGEMYNYVLGKMNSKMGIRYLKELVKIVPDYDNNMLDITVIGDTRKTASDVMGYIKDSIASSQENITKAIGEHENNLVDESQFVTVDLELDKTQTEFAANTDQLDISLKEKTKELSELEEPKNSLLSKSSVLKSAIKYAVLGGVLGAFMVVFFLCVAFLMSDKLVSEKELKRRYGIMVLGVFSKHNKKRAFAFIDRWLDKLEGTSAREMEDSRTFEVVAANAINYIEQDSIRDVILVGTVENEKLEQVHTGLAAMLGSVELTVGGNLGKDASAIKKAASCDAVVIVEQRGNSMFSGIEQELDLVRSLGKKVIGCIVL